MKPNTIQKIIKKKSLLLAILGLSMISAAVGSQSPSNISSTGSIIYWSRVDVSVDVNTTIDTNNLSLGFHLSNDWNFWLQRSVLRSFAQNASFKLIRLFDYAVKPCGLWNETAGTGTFDWTSVDTLVQSFFNTGAEPIFVLGCPASPIASYIPSGMAVNPSTTLPYPDTWAAYCREWVKHFKTTGKPVRYYEVMNEPASYFGWNDYAKMANFMAVWNAAALSVRTENPQVLLGFEGTNRRPVLDYWLANGGANLDYICIHKYDGGVIGYRTDADMLNRAETWLIETDASYYGVLDAQQTYYKARGKLIPMVNSESNYDSAFATGSDPEIQQMVGATWLALVLRTEIIKGMTYSVYYSFTSGASWDLAHTSSGGVGFGMINTDNNQPWYPYYVQNMIGSNLAVGDSIMGTTSSLSDVRSLAWVHGTKLNLLLICKVPESRVVQLYGLSGLMNYSKIDNTISWQTPRVQTGSVDPTKPISMNGYTVILLQGSIPASKPPSTPPSVSPSSTTFADGFESGSFSAWTGITTTSGETATIVNTVKHSGIYSARLASNGGLGYEATYSYENVASSSDLYTRGYFYVSTSGISSNENRFYFIILRAGGNPVAYAGWRMAGGVVKWNLLIRDGSGWASASSASSPSLNQWYSVELHWKEDSSNGLGELFINGALVCSVSSKNTAYYGDVNRVDVGLAEVYNCGPTQIYCDDSAISSRSIGP
jgi:hypothetical protein